MFPQPPFSVSCDMLEQAPGAFQINTAPVTIEEWSTWWISGYNECNSLETKPIQKKKKKNSRSDYASLNDLTGVVVLSFLNLSVSRDISFVSSF